MGNTTLGAALKGSKFQMQRLTLPENQNKFNEFIGDNLNWFSPLLEDKFKEYRMNSPVLLNELGISQAIKKEYLNTFWPSPQPQWDGIAWGKNNTLYLFEAKSHISEIAPGKDGNPENDKKKYDSIMLCAKQLFGIEDTERNRGIWCKKYYQISNRIAFTNQLRKIGEVSSKVRYKNIITIFLNFVNDLTWRKERLTVETSNQWEQHYCDTIFPELNISKDKLEKNNIFIKHFDLKRFE